MKAQSKALNNPLIAFEHKRDAYGFTVRPQHVQRYREYANIYKEEEEERSDKWKNFLEWQAESSQILINEPSSEENKKGLHGDAEDKDTCNGLQELPVEGVGNGSEKLPEEGELGSQKPGSDAAPAEREDEQSTANKQIHRIQIWADVRPSLRAIEDMMSIRVKKKGNQPNNQKDAGRDKPLNNDDAKMTKGGIEEDSEDEFYDVEKSDPIQDVTSNDGISVSATGMTNGDATPQKTLFPCKEELEFMEVSHWPLGESSGKHLWV